jgi:hypothetical protein
VIRRMYGRCCKKYIDGLRKFKEALLHDCLSVILPLICTLFVQTEPQNGNKRCLIARRRVTPIQEPMQHTQ